MRTFKLVTATISLGLILTLAGCGGGDDGANTTGMTQEQWKAIIHPGMTEAEVIAIAGRPPDGHGPITGVPHSGQLDVWTFGNEEGYAGLNSSGKVDLIGWGHSW